LLKLLEILLSRKQSALARSALTYTYFLNPFIAQSKYGIDLLCDCGIILDIVYVCGKGFFVEPGEHTAREMGGQLGARRWYN